MQHLAEPIVLFPTQAHLLLQSVAQELQVMAQVVGLQIKELVQEQAAQVDLDHQAVAVVVLIQPLVVLTTQQVEQVAQV